MNRGGKAIVLAASLAWATGGVGQAIAPAGLEETAPTLTLDLPVLRSAMDHMNMPGAFLEKLPDIRLKLDRSDEFLLHPLSWEERLRGVEIRLPMSAFWVGYNLPVEAEDPQATFSIRLGF